MVKNPANQTEHDENCSLPSRLQLSTMAQRLTPLSRQTSILLLCDMQDKFRPTVKYFPQIVETSNKLLQACKLLGVPFVVTEQYPKGMVAGDKSCLYCAFRRIGTNGARIRHRRCETIRKDALLNVYAGGYRTYERASQR